MTTLNNFAKNTRWGHTDHTKSTLHHHPKKLNPTEASLFDILPTVILTDIEIWVYGLNHCDKLKAVVSRITLIYNTILFTITHELWTPTTILGSTSGIMRYYTNEHICAPHWVCAISTTGT